MLLPRSCTTRPPHSFRTDSISNLFNFIITNTRVNCTRMLEMERSTDSTVTDDTTCSLSTLRAQAGKPLRDVILEIYAQHWRANIKSIDYLTNLKCFLPAETASECLLHRDGQERPVTILLTPCSPVERYVALSYPWSPSYSESNTMGGYWVLERTVSVRNIALDRTIRFIWYKQGSRGMIPF